MHRPGLAQHRRISSGRWADCQRPMPRWRRWVRCWGVLAGCMLCLSTALVAAQQGTDASTRKAPRPLAAIPAHRQADNVAIITIDTMITRVTAYSFIRRLKMAEAGGADAFVVELDTPGGEVGAVLDITDAIRQSSISNSVAWIHSNAYSGGAIIALACKEIVTDEPARMGDALPIQFGPGGLRNMPIAERQKITAPLLAEVVSSARMRGWDEFIVQGFVALDVELWWVRDTQTGRYRAINEAEYRMLFDGEPPRTSPMIVSAPDRRKMVARSGGSGVSSKLDDTDSSTRETQPPHKNKAPQPQDDTPTSQPDTQPDAIGSTPFAPASPALQAMEVASEAIGRASMRSPITPADKGRYELVGYLCSGDGPLILSAQDMAMLGFASNVDAKGNLIPIRNDTDLARFFGAKHIRRLSPTWSESLVLFMSNAAVRGVLIVVFLMALFLEMSHPGIGLPGGVAMVALLALLGPPALIGMANWWEIGAILVGLLLIGIEVFILPGFGIPGLAGLLLLFGGLVGTFVGDTSGGLFPDSPHGQSQLMYGMVTILLSSTTAIVGMYFLAKHFGSIPILGGLVLTHVSGQASDEDDEGLFGAMTPEQKEQPEVGAVGKTLTPLRPAGRARFGSMVVDVVSDLGYIEAGEMVRVTASDAFRIVVDKAEGHQAN